MKQVTVEGGVRIMAGTMVLVSVCLAMFVNKWWLALAVFVGLNLIQSAFTGFCPADKIMKAIGLPTSAGTCCAPRVNKKEELLKEVDNRR